MIYLDTHVAVWLYNGEEAKLSEGARSAIRRNDVLLSPAALLECAYMYELGRLRDHANDVLGALHSEYGVRLCELPFPSVVSASLPLSWTKDPFDRLIVGHAIAGRRKLVTKDSSIRDHFDDAVW